MLNVVTGVILAPTLGPSGRREPRPSSSGPRCLGWLGNLGVVDSVTFHSARRSAPQRSIVSTSLAIALVQSTLLVAIGLVLVPLVLAKQEASVVRDCLIFLASIPTSLVTLYLGSVLNGTHRFVAFNVVRATVFVGNAAGLVALAIGSELTVTSAMFAYLASQVVTVLIAAILVLPSTGPSQASSEAARPRDAGLRLAQPAQHDLEPAQRASGSAGHLDRARPRQSRALRRRLDRDVAVLDDRLLRHVRGASQGGAGGVGTGAQSEGAPLRFPHLRGDRSGTIPVLLLAPRSFASSSAATSSRPPAWLGVLVASVALGTGRVLESVLKGVNRPLHAGLAEGAGLIVTAAGLAALLPTLGLMGAAITSLAAYTVTAGVARTSSIAPSIRPAPSCSPRTATAAFRLMAGAIVADPGGLALDALDGDRARPRGPPAQPMSPRSQRPSRRSGASRAFRVRSPPG